MSSGSQAHLGVPLELSGGGRALFTDRSHGNLSLLAGEAHQHGPHGREQLCHGLGLQWLCAGPQVHGSEVQRVRRLAGAGGEPVALDADGHATALPGLGVMVLAADCLPVALGCDGAVAILHAGWRGLAGGVLEEGVRALRELGGDGPIDAIVGPGAGACCYEVGREVQHALGLTPARRANIDLKALARARLRHAGVAAVLDIDACTICDERFFSYRREGERAGRQAGVAWLS